MAARCQCSSPVARQTSEEVATSGPSSTSVSISSGGVEMSAPAAATMEAAGGVGGGDTSKSSVTFSGGNVQVSSGGGRPAQKRLM